MDFYNISTKQKKRRKYHDKQLDQAPTHSDRVLFSLEPQTSNTRAAVVVRTTTISTCLRVANVTVARSDCGTRERRDHKRIISNGATGGVGVVARSASCQEAIGALEKRVVADEVGEGWREVAAESVGPVGLVVVVVVRDG